jgi:hypothetical protein
LANCILSAATSIKPIIRKLVAAPGKGVFHIVIFLIEDV